MKEFFEHIKRVAIEDFKDFFEPYVWVYRGVRRFIHSSCRKIKSLLGLNKKGD